MREKCVEACDSLFCLGIAWFDAWSIGVEMLSLSPKNLAHALRNDGKKLMLLAIKKEQCVER